MSRRVFHRYYLSPPPFPLPLESSCFLSAVQISATAPVSDSLHFSKFLESTEQNSQIGGKRLRMVPQMFCFTITVFKIYEWVAKGKALILNPNCTLKSPGKLSKRVSVWMLPSEQFHLNLVQTHRCLFLINFFFFPCHATQHARS